MSAPSRRVRLLQGVGLGLLAAVLVLVYGLRTTLDVRPGGAVFVDEGLPIFLALLLVAGALVMWRPLVGAAAGGLTMAALAVFTARLLHPASAAALLTAAGLPQVMLLVINGVGRAGAPPAPGPSRRRVLSGLAGVALVTSAGWWAGRYVFSRIWGPTHPASTVRALPRSAVDWLWSGALTSSSCAVRVRPHGRVGQARLLIATDEAFTDVRPVPIADVFDRVLDFRVSGLQPATRYFYRVELDGVADVVRTGTVRTAPEQRAPLRLAFGSCARNGSNGAVFDAIGAYDPLVYVCLGDFHYGDNFVDDVRDYRLVLDLQLDQPAQAALYRSTPIAYVWDDHDYGPNDSDKDAPGRRAAMVAYREYVPHYGLDGPTSPIHQAFTLGSVRVVLTDARSARDPRRRPDTVDKSMLGFEQRTWLLDELVDGATRHDLVIWVNPVPWIGSPRAGSDTWAGYAAERALIADHIADHGIDNLLMVSGDAHMVAIDDGTNTNYSASPGKGFPLLHVAALDRPGGTKGGPYTQGPIPGGGHFGTVDVTPAADGQGLDVELAARSWDERLLLDHRYTVATTPS